MCARKCAHVGWGGEAAYSLLVYPLCPSSVTSRVTSCPALLQKPNTSPQDTVAVPDPGSPLRPLEHKCPLWPQNTSARELPAAPGSYHTKNQLPDVASRALGIQPLPAPPTIPSYGNTTAASLCRYGALPMMASLPFPPLRSLNPTRNALPAGPARPQGPRKPCLPSAAPPPSPLPGLCCSRRQPYGVRLRAGAQNTTGIWALL